MLNRFGMTITKSMCTPLTMSIHLFELNATQSESEKEYMSHVPYTHAIGSLMYALVCTRLDAAQVVSVVSSQTNI